VGELKLGLLNAFALEGLFVANRFRNATLEDILFRFGNCFEDFGRDPEVFC